MSLDTSKPMRVKATGKRVTRYIGATTYGAHACEIEDYDGTIMYRTDSLENIPEHIGPRQTILYEKNGRLAHVTPANSKGWKAITFLEVMPGDVTVKVDSEFSYPIRCESDGKHLDQCISDKTITIHGDRHE